MSKPIPAKPHKRRSCPAQSGRGVVMRAALDIFRKHVGFVKVPLSLPDDDAALMGFFHFANGGSKEAKALRAAFGESRNILEETLQQTAAAYIDWLIETQWGEAGKEIAA